jgi:hypothetical protein
MGVNKKPSTPRQQRRLKECKLVQKFNHTSGYHSMVGAGSVLCSKGILSLEWEMGQNAESYSSFAFVVQDLFSCLDENSWKSLYSSVLNSNVYKLSNLCEPRGEVR